MRIKGRTRRHFRINKKLRGHTDRPRLVVFRSNKHTYAQLVDDKSLKVIASCSTLSKEFKDMKIKTTDKEAASQVGKLLAQKIIKLGINQIRFDRAGYKYHGRVKVLADSAREGGLVF